MISQEFNRGAKYRMVLCRCTQCGTEKWINYGNLRAGKTRGCQSCSQKCGAPEWLLRRMESARQRCTNPNDKWYQNYGGRGLEFRFESVAAAAVWVMENLGLERDKEIDRIDNNRGYEPGNLRWATRQQNANNRRASVTAQVYKIRTEFPHVRYADTTLRGFFCKGVTIEEVVERWSQPSCKPKGVYGTFSTPDPDIVSPSAEC